MAEFHGIFCRPFLPSALITERVSGMGGREGGVGQREEEWGGVEGGKNLHLGHPMSSHDTHTVPNYMIVSHIVSGSKPRSPLPNWRPPWVPLFQS